MKDLISAQSLALSQRGRARWFAGTLLNADNSWMKNANVHLWSFQNYLLFFFVQKQWRIQIYARQNVTELPTWVWSHQEYIFIVTSRIPDNDIRESAAPPPPPPNMALQVNTWWNLLFLPFSFFLAFNKRAQCRSCLSNKFLWFSFGPNWKKKQ